MADHFLKLANRRLGRQVSGLTPEAMQLIRRHDWPGNVRELQSAISYAVIHAPGGVVTPRELPRHVRGADEPLGPWRRSRRRGSTSG